MVQIFHGICRFDAGGYCSIASSAGLRGHDIFQIYYDLDIWLVVIVGVAGSILGRYILTLYIPIMAGRIFKPSKNEDVHFLGAKLKEKGWKSHLAIFTYSLLPLPTTPLFIAGGMAKMKPYLILPAFALGKFTSDTLAVLIGKYATETTPDILSGVISWKIDLRPDSGSAFADYAFVY